MNSQVSRCPLCYWISVRNKSRKNEEMEPKQKQHPVVDVTGDGKSLMLQRIVLHRNLEC